MIDRRALLLAGLGLAFEQIDQSASRPKAGDLLVKAGDATKKALTASDMQTGAPQTLAWPMDPTDRVVRSGSRLNQIVLLRLDAETLTVETRAPSGARAAAQAPAPISQPPPPPPPAPMPQVLRDYKPVTAERLKNADASDWLMVR